MIRRAVRNNPDAVVAVTGCYAQTAANEIMEMPGVDIVIGNQDRDKIIPLVEQFQKERQPINAVRNIMKTRTYEELDVPHFTERTRAFLKIQEGCNNFCTFCIIPWTRGLSRSRAPEKVLEQARQLVSNGYHEIVLTGIHTGGYGDDLDNYSIADLIQDLEKIDGLNRIRISSIEASQVTDRVIEVMQNSEKLCRHLHIPLQAGHDYILKKMRRKYTTAEYAQKIEQLHQALPGAAITTDVIVGFPGETDEMFEQGREFIARMGFSELHVFPYSKRSGTPASVMPDQVDKEVKDRRVSELIALSNQLNEQYAKRFLNKVVEVIPEREHGLPGSGLISGHSDNYLHVVMQGSKELIGSVVRVKIKETSAGECRGTIVRVMEPAAHARKEASV